METENNNFILTTPAYMISQTIMLSLFYYKLLLNESTSTKYKLQLNSKNKPAINDSIIVITKYNTFPNLIKPQLLLIEVSEI